jgi:hypothetical protein
MFRVVSPPIVRSTNNCMYSIWYWSTVVATRRYRGGATVTSNGILVPDAVDTVICAPDDGWRNPPETCRAVYR